MDYIQKTYKFKLRPSRSQVIRLDKWIDTCRAVYNLALETKINAYQAHRVYVSHYQLSKQVTAIRKDFDWIKDVPRATLECVLERLDKSYQSFFRGSGFPKFISKGNYGSVEFKSVRIDTHNRVLLQKIGSIKYFNSQEIKGELRRAIITRKNGNYYISILTRQERNTPSISYHDSQVGIDMGVAFFASLSNGDQIENPRHSINHKNRLRIEQRSLSRKVKGSRRYRQQSLFVAKLHYKIARQRKDFIHKQSRSIVGEYGFVAVEDLNVAGLVKSSRVGKHILDASWSEFICQLEYKADWNGGTLEKVNPAYTSQTCNHCGEVNKKSRISQSKFVCTACGAEDNADVNAAKNILVRAIANVREREPLGCALGENS